MKLMLLLVSAKPTNMVMLVNSPNALVILAMKIKTAPMSLMVKKRKQYALVKKTYTVMTVNTLSQLKRNSH